MELMTKEIEEKLEQVQLLYALRRIAQAVCGRA